MTASKKKADKTRTWVFYTMDDYIHNRVTGGTKRFQELIYDLSNLGDTIHLFIPVPNNIEIRENIHIHSIKRMESKVFPNLFLSFFRNFKTLKKIKRLDYDSVVLISIPYGIQGKLLGLKNITLIIWEDLLGYNLFRFKSKKLALKRFLAQKTLRWIEKMTLNHAEKVITQCEYDKEILKQRHKTINKKIDSKTLVIPNNVNPSWLKSRDDLIKDQTVTLTDNLKFVFVGNIDDKRKGLHILLNAVRSLVDRNYEIELGVIGDGSLLKHYSEEYKDYDKIVFYGHQKDPLSIISEYHAMVVPSLADSFPNTVMEGLYLEMCVIGSRAGGIPEMLKYKELLFEPNSEDLAGKIVKLTDRDTFKRCKNLASERKQALTFDWSSELRKVL